MKNRNRRRDFLKQITLGGLGAGLAPLTLHAADTNKTAVNNAESTGLPAAARPYNGPYAGAFNNKIAFPIGGIGTGMFCVEGTGAISHMSVRHVPDIYNEPAMFAAIRVKGAATPKVLEGPVPDWKKFGQHDSGLGGRGGATWGLPRFNSAAFEARFPFCTVEITDQDIPLAVSMQAWNPFIPNNADHSGLPVGALEYTFKNTGSSPQEAVFSYHSRNFMQQPEAEHSIGGMQHGFILSAAGTGKAPAKEGHFAIFTNEPATVVDHCWFRGGWFDPLTMVWQTVSNGDLKNTPPVPKDAPGASLYVPFTLAPGQQKTIRVMMAWYVPHSTLRIGEFEPADEADQSPARYYRPWYASRFKNIQDVAGYWKDNYASLQQQSLLFRRAFYNSTLPPEVLEAIAANLTILKSTTVMRVHDGRFWAWEGSGDSWGSCHGSCTHVWNYAQAVPHLFPALERTLRDTEFAENQDGEGHQVFRANMPITKARHTFHAAADGQLGGIMKVYREWRISNDKAWLEKKYPFVQKSLDYCIRTWDPDKKGMIAEPHHNTYDIEFWGATGMCTSFYLGALRAFAAMGKYLGHDVSAYEALYEKGRTQLENALYNGEYFIQQIQWKGLHAPDPVKAQSFSTGYSPEALALLQKEGPKYQYGAGCLSDGVLGAWIARMCGLDDIADPDKIKSHLQAVHKYNLRQNLAEHVNPQRPTFALGAEGGLLLCSWPKGGKLSLPFVYSNEAWTGIEYQVASHLVMMGEVEKGLDIVRTCRNRYNGQVRNPFNEYECGHWYARAMASYGLLQALTGLRYDAVDKTLYVHSRVGDFTSFLSTAGGFGNVTLKNGKVAVNMVSGRLDVSRIVVNGKTLQA
ncbi:MAG TPA: GH116 family glycosyl hydrolase [Chitinophaga sp.]|uniref:GH116 family glycosyl hydrolase n=1 Tax=Chitinophaga sp. TaxID=1869181 RepID=UPI002DBDFD82|nr:GH116 family glycosyl hydrolase [Chitinophaga sp.]HEU4551923.1 GH116 family glycosyl hydrolase [Chitinophaga sp.]